MPKTKNTVDKKVTPKKAAKEEPILETEPSTTPYKLKARMNVRKAASITAERIGIAEAGTIVNVYEIKDDWMKVQWNNGFAYILYQNGNFAEKERN